MAGAPGRRVRLPVAAAGLLAVAAVVATLAAFGVFGGDDEEKLACPVGEGGNATVYSSLPQHGVSQLQTEAIQNGIRLALGEADGKAGGCTIEYVALDDSDPVAGFWGARQTERNAERAAADPATIAYIGEFNSGATIVSLPILNEARVLQVSPSNTAVGLTTDGPGADRREPDKYYPSDVRTYARVHPNDRVQGGALVALARDERCQSVFLVSDGELYGYGVIMNARAAAEEAGIHVTGMGSIKPRARSYRTEARDIGKADCMIFAGITKNNAVELFDTVAAVDRDVRLYAADGVAEAAFADPKEGGISPATARRTKITVATLAPLAYPPAGQDFFRDYADKHPGNPDPYAIYGYEAMSLVLDVIERANEHGDDRMALLDALFATKGRQSVLGTYDINRNGDFTLRSYGVYAVRKGRLDFDGKVESLLGP